MANAYKLLGRSNPGASLTALYTVPASTEAIAWLWIAEVGGTNATYRVTLAPGGAADAITHRLAWDAPIKANGSIPFPIPFDLATTDVVRVYGSDTDVVFNLWGIEIT